MDYYEMKRRATLDLIKYTERDDPEPWSEFCSTMLKKYGFSGKTMRKILDEASEKKLTVHDDELCLKAELDEEGIYYE